ncbi:hypothetical protein TrCOL_g4269 [Triparma columacea]|uniref:Uncharacterized protein n=1 Tax=Triparma columacea TaxID=722753 RepID=A0A9W7L9G2_9STRA|nr:hypothetical protein TrCOL_g4269 [Triparma columacea]
MRGYGSAASGRVIVRMSRSLSTTSSVSTPTGSDTPTTDTPKYSFGSVSNGVTPKSTTSSVASSTAKTPGGAKTHTDGVHEVYWDDVLCRMITRKVDTSGCDNLSKALSTARDNYDEEEDVGFESDSSGPAFKPNRRSVSWSLNRAKKEFGEDGEEEDSDDDVSPDPDTSTPTTQMEYFPPPPSSPSSPTAAVNVSFSSTEDEDPTPTALTSSFFGKKSKTNSTTITTTNTTKKEKTPKQPEVIDFTTTISTKKKKKSYAGTAKMNGRYSASVTGVAFDDIETPRPPPLAKKGSDLPSSSLPTVVDDHNTPAPKAPSRKKGGYGSKASRKKGKTTLSQYFSAPKPQQEDDALSSASTASTTSLPNAATLEASSLLSPPRTPALGALKPEVKGRVTRALSMENAANSDDIISESEGEEESPKEMKQEKESEEEKKRQAAEEGKRKRVSYGGGAGADVTVTPKVSAFSTRRLDPKANKGGEEGKKRAGKSKYFSDIEMPTLTNAVTPAAPGSDSNSSSKKRRRVGYGGKKKKKSSGQEEALERQREYFKSLENQSLKIS